MRGVVKWYHPVKHIGFLVTDRGNQEMFLHINDCEGFTPAIGMAVEFDIGQDWRGRTKAIRIRKI
jgi:cold shock CspA family protein